MAHKHPTISIIVPNKNYGRYIRDTIESVRAQTFSDFECIIIDDASTDNSISVIHRAIKNDARFKLIQHKSSLGVSAARNSGLDAACGEYIAFLDSDDCMTQYALEMLLNLARTTGADMIGAQTTIVPESYKYIPTPNMTYSMAQFGIARDPAQFLLMPQSSNWCWIWRRIYRRAVIQDVRFDPEFTTFGDDLAFMLDICHRTDTIVETPNVAVMHRYHPQSITNTSFSVNNFYFFPKLFQKISSELIDKYPPHFWHKFVSRTFMYMMSETIIKPKRMKTLERQAKAVLLQACKHVPIKYLNTKQKILCRFFRCIK